MLDTLLESKSQTHRSAGGAAVSVTAHTILIAAALYATAQARVQPARPSLTDRPIYFPLPQPLAPNASPNASSLAHPNGHRLPFVEPRFDIRIPAIDVSGMISSQGDFHPRGIDPSGNGGPSAPTSTGEPYRAEQVEKQVAVVPGNPAPRYPELLRSSGVEGQVIALFVVDESGRAEQESISFIRSDNRLFEDAVKQALRRMKFVSAEIGGRKVRQLVQMPFVFTLAR